MNNGQVSSKNVLLVECLKRPGVENMAFRTNLFLLATNSPRRSIPYYIREHLNACCQENPTPTTTDFIEIKMTDQASSSTSPFKPDVVIRRGAVSIEISNTATEELLNKVGGLLHA